MRTAPHTANHHKMHNIRSLNIPALLFVLAAATAVLVMVARAGEQRRQNISLSLSLTINDARSRRFGNGSIWARGKWPNATDQAACAQRLCLHDFMMRDGGIALGATLGVCQIKSQPILCARSGDENVISFLCSLAKLCFSQFEIHSAKAKCSMCSSLWCAHGQYNAVLQALLHRTFAKMVNVAAAAVATAPSSHGWL